MCEGDEKRLQRYLCGYRSNGNHGINILAEICKQLLATYTCIRFACVPGFDHSILTSHDDTPNSDGSEWIDMIEQYITTITELCQGCAENQQEVLDNQIVKVVNHFISSHSSDLSSIYATAKVVLVTLEFIEVRTSMYVCLVICTAMGVCVCEGIQYMRVMHFDTPCLHTAKSCDFSMNSEHVFRRFPLLFHCCLVSFCRHVWTSIIQRRWCGLI